MIETEEYYGGTYPECPEIESSELGEYEEYISEVLHEKMVLERDDIDG